jgi:hypothetical protein
MQQASGKNESSALIKEPVANSEVFCNLIVSLLLYLFKQLPSFALERRHIE